MLVSICIPTYSRLHYLQQAFLSAKNQTYRNIEICISQNPKAEGADTSIKEWCEQKASAGELMYHLNTKNLGLTGNLNVLAKLAKGDYLIFLGDDDLLHADYVSTLINTTEIKHPDIIFCNQVFIDAEGDVLEKTTAHLNTAYKRDELNEGFVADTVQCIFNNSVPLSAALIRKELCETYSFNENLNTPELPFFLRVALNNGSFFYTGNQLAYYRLHKNSETNNGLTTDGLLKEVIDIDVPAKYQDIKRNFIEKAMIPSVNKALIKGNAQLARFLLKSGYYPNNRVKKVIQQIMTFFPVKVVKLIFNIRITA